MAEKLPIFPMEMVLLPGTQVMLKLLESQHKKLVDDCVRDAIPFGVIYCSDSDHPLATMSMIGCLANIIEVTPFEDGSYTARVEGGERFIAKSVSLSKHSYYDAEYEPLPEDMDMSLDDSLFESIIHLLDIYLELLEAIDPDLVEDLPDDLSGYDLTFTVLDHMAVGDAVRQKGLEINSLKERAHFCLQLLRQEIERLRFLLSESGEDDDEDEDGFSMPQRMN